MLSYLGFAFTVLFPLYFVYRAWRSRFDTIAAWGLHVVNGFALLGLLLVVGRMDLAGRPWLYGLYALCALGLIGSWVRVANRPLRIDGQAGLSWTALLDTGALLFLLGWGLLGYWPDREPVELTFPLQGEDYYVMHGGGTFPVNYHGLFASSQRYALDIGRLNEWGTRAAGLSPDRLSTYEVYGAPVYSPLAGTVVDTAGHLPDLTPGERMPEQPTGNHVWLRRDSLYVVLAHLREGSVQVTPGERVQAGERLGAVGNTGNTTEPHLHVHAVTLPPGAAPNSDSLLGRGTPVPLQFDGRFLTRNDLFTQRQRAGSAPTQHAAAPNEEGD